MASGGAGSRSGMKGIPFFLSFGRPDVEGGEDLIALSVEENGDVIGLWGSVMSEDMGSGDGDDLSAGGEGEGFGECDGDAEAGEGARAGRDIELAQVARRQVVGLAKP